MGEIALRVDGLEYRGWTDVSVSRSIGSIAGTFDVTASENPTEDAPMNPDAQVVVLIGNVPVLTGWVDQRREHFDDKSRSLRLAGRSLTADMVDCSAMLGQWDFLNVSLLDFATKLTSQFGIPLTVDGDLHAKVTLRGTTPKGKLRTGGAPGTSAKSSSAASLRKAVVKQSINPGDSAFECLDKACRMAGVLPIADAYGGVVLTRAGTDVCTTALIEGENILSAEVVTDMTRRFRRYVVRGQSQGTDDIFGAPVAQVSGEAQDMGARPNRVLMIRPEGNVTVAFARARAEWEATHRMALSENIKVVVQGWEDVEGSPWPINTLVQVRLPRLGVAGLRLIASVEYKLSATGGTTTELELVRPDAYAPEPVIIKSEKSGLDVPEALR